MNNAAEPILAALFQLLQNAVVINFTGTGTSGSPVITGLSSVAGFFTGLPAFGPGVPRGALIQSFDPVGLTCTLDQDLNANAPPASAFNTGFLYASRRAKLWTQQQEQPAMFLRHVNDIDSYGGGVLQRRILDCEVWIYSRAGEDPDVAPDTALNNLAQAIRAACAPDPRGWPQTLASVNNGVPMVQWVRVEGESQYDPGDLDKQGKALIPLKILCP